MTDGALTEETDAASLRHDMACILLSHSSDRPGGLRLTQEEAFNLAGQLERAWFLRIGGRYISNRAQREARNAEIYAKFTGNNRDQLARLFELSPKTISRAIADHRKVLNAVLMGWRK